MNSASVSHLDENVDSASVLAAVQELDPVIFLRFVDQLAVIWTMKPDPMPSPGLRCLAHLWRFRIDRVPGLALQLLSRRSDQVPEIDRPEPDEIVG